MNKRNDINQIPQLLLRCENECLGEQYKFSIIRLLKTLKLNLIEAKKYIKSEENDEDVYIIIFIIFIRVFLSVEVVVV